MPSLERILTSFLGRRVRVWTRYIEAPEEGVLIFFNLKPPYLLLIKDDDGKYHIYNWKEVVKIDCIDNTRV